MKQSLSDKKKFAKSGFCADTDHVTLCSHVLDYGKLFRVYRRDNSPIAQSYILGLFNSPKSERNMERMCENNQLQGDKHEYHQYVHFLSESKWDWAQVNAITARQTSDLLLENKQKSGRPTGLIIDESCHLKKGRESVGVSRQYAGQIGKVDNCQVAVYASLANQKYTTLIDSRLFLPQEWTSDGQRLEKAHVPESFRQFKTKPQLALEMVIQAKSRGIAFDWIGGDGLYGHNSELTRALDDQDLFYVLDVHKDEHIYMECPTIAVPERKADKGRTPTRLKADKDSVPLQEYYKSLMPNDFQKVRVRKTVKGTKIVWAHIVRVWHWDGKEQQARQRTLIISLDKKEKSLKYSFSNGGVDQYSLAEYVWFQWNRYWVERSFDDAKNELGLSGYQVRGWHAWHHHIALVMMAGLYLLKCRMKNENKYPLMSTKDARILIIGHLFATPDQLDMLYRQMGYRHLQRKRDMDRYDKMENEHHGSESA